LFPWLESKAEEERFKDKLEIFGPLGEPKNGVANIPIG
jgi:hypothetical protein